MLRSEKILSQYIAKIKDLILDVKNSCLDHEVNSVTNDSRKVVFNSIFVAIKGAVTDGHEYIEEAVNKGAKIIVYQNSLPSELSDQVVYIKVNDAYFAYSLLVEKYFNEPAERLKLIAVTGTNGKTTSAYLIYNILKHAGKNTGLISTIDYRYGDMAIPASRTTPEAFELQSLLARMLDAGCEYVVMEVSSHALDQHRVPDTKFAAGLFTNLSGEHLDYHITMENYFLAKKKLFSDYMSEKSVAVFNIDDAYGKRLSETITNCRVKLYGTNNDADYKIVLNEKPCDGCIKGIEADGSAVTLKTSLTGWYNAYNIAGAFAVCSELGVEKNMIATALAADIKIPGRLEMVPVSKHAKFFVDYAHTDDALMRVLTALKQLQPENLIVVFVCGGDRDRTKRSRMGQVVSEIADKIIITSDNPRTENPHRIIEDIIEGIDQNKNFRIIENRRQAIHYAIDIAGEGDIVIVAGKGHEDYQEINGIKYPFSDVEVIKEIYPGVSIFGKTTSKI